MNSAVLEVSGESTSGLDKEGVLVMIRSTARPLTLKLAPCTTEIRRQPATGKPPVRDAPDAVEDKSSVRMEEEIELELKQLRGQRGGASSPSAIVRRGQTTKQFMDDSKRAAKGGLGV